MTSELPPQLPPHLSAYPESIAAGPYASPSAPLSPPDALPAAEDIQRPGPGALISFCWLIGLFGGQILFTIFAIVIVIGVNAVNGVPFDPAKLEESGWTNTMLIGASQFATALVALIAALVHARKNTVERLQLRLPQARHWALGILAVIPMSIIATEAAIVVGQLDGFSLKFLEESVKGVDSMPLAAMLLFGCAFPGLFEELLFRGVMGRGMTERHGVWTGVTVASVFFGIAHLVPAHAVSAAIMGVFLHLAFLYSRSFWVPVIMHFINNSLAFLTSRYDQYVPIPGYTTDLDSSEGLHIPAPLLACGVLAAVMLVTCWRYFKSPPQSFEKQPPTAASEAPQCITVAPTRPAAIGWLLVGALLASQALLIAVLANSVER
jgi:membrane protease YdiL (CAAX protease family)